MSHIMEWVLNMKLEAPVYVRCLNAFVQRSIPQHSKTQLTNNEPPQMLPHNIFKLLICFCHQLHTKTMLSQRYHVMEACATHHVCRCETSKASQVFWGWGNCFTDWWRRPVPHATQPLRNQTYILRKAMHCIALTPNACRYRSPRPSVVAFWVGKSCPSSHPTKQAGPYGRVRGQCMAATYPSLLVAMVTGNACR